MGTNNPVQPTGKKLLFLFLVLVSFLAAIGYVVAFAVGNDNLSGGLIIV